MDVFLVRHGQSAANAGLTRDLDSGLTPLGRRQAELTGARLQSESIGRAFVSPLLRTLETMDVLCRKIGIRAIAFPEVHEYFSPKHVEYLSFQGLSGTDIRRRFPLIDTSDDYPCGSRWWPGDFEDRDKAYRRAERVRDLLLARYSDSDKAMLIVGHADPIGWLIEAFARDRPEAGSPLWLDNCSITQIRVLGKDAPAVPILFNDTNHLKEDGR
jgi:broad specificity phosphatase PhoE